MSQVLFKSAKGFADENVSYLSGVGAPGDDTSYQDAAPKGSHYQDVSTGYSFVKVADGAGAGNWKKLATSEDLSTLVTGISWREPVAVTDTVAADTSTILTDINADDAIQGYTVQAGVRILLTNTSAHPNVYIVSGSTGAWTLTEDTNEESLGDTVQTLFGDNAGRVYTFSDGGAGADFWQWTGTQSNAEDVFIRSFIGKSAAGSVTPSYSTNNYVANADSLTTAVGKLDARAKTNANDIASLQSYTSNTQTEVNAIEASLGTLVSNSGTWVGFSGTNYLNTASDVTNAITILDTRAKSNADAIISEAGTRGTADTNLGLRIDALNTAAGISGDVYGTITGSNYLNATTTFRGADLALDAAIKAVSDLVGTSSSAAIQAELDAAELAIGLATNGTLVAFTGNYTTGATSVVGAIAALDTKVKSTSDGLAQEILDRAAADTVIRDIQDAFKATVDVNADGTQKAWTGSTTYITGKTTFKSAVEALDVAAKANADAIALEITNRGTAVSGVQTEVNAIETSLGSFVKIDGTWNGVSGTTYMNSATTVSGALTALDTALALLASNSSSDLSALVTTLGCVADTHFVFVPITGNYTGSATSIKGAVQALDTQLKTTQNNLTSFIAGAGLTAVTGAYSANGSANYISTATSLKNADDLLDAAIKVVDTRSSNTVTTLGSFFNANGTVAGVTGSNYLDATTTITGALLALDTALSTANTNILNEVNAIETAVGLASNGTFTTITGTYTGGTTIVGAIQSLDAQVVINTAAISTETSRASGEEGFIRAFIGKGAAGSETPTYATAHYVTQSSNLEAAIGALDAALFTTNGNIGDRLYTSTNVVVSGSTVTAAISALDASLASSVAPSSVNNVTTVTVIDSVNVDDVSTSKWIYTITLVSDETCKQSGEVLAIHNGTPTADATNTDFNEFAELRLGAKIPGLVIDTTLTGSGATQKMNLTVKANVAVNVRATRVRVAI